MNTNSKILKVLTVLYLMLFLPLLANSQCYDDFFGFWKTDDGKFIKLVDYDPIKKIGSPTLIGDRDQSFSGTHFYEDKILKIRSYEHSYNDKTKESKWENKSFDFKVITVNKQLMKIRPISEEMKSLFGQKEITLFNEYFTPFDAFELDSLYLDGLQIDKAGNMKLEKDFSYGRKKKRNYSGFLNEKQFNELKKLVIMSQITSMSNCDLIYDCSDCYPLGLKIFHNNKFTYYRRGIIHGSAAPLVRRLDEIVLETKWKKIKKKKTAGKKS